MQGKSNVIRVDFVHKTIVNEYPLLSDYLKCGKFTMDVAFENAYYEQIEINDCLNDRLDRIEYSASYKQQNLPEYIELSELKFRFCRDTDGQLTLNPCMQESRVVFNVQTHDVVCCSFCKNEMALEKTTEESFHYRHTCDFDSEDALVTLERDVEKDYINPLKWLDEVTKVVRMDDGRYLFTLFEGNYFYFDNQVHHLIDKETNSPECPFNHVRCFENETTGEEEPIVYMSILEDMQHKRTYIKTCHELSRYMPVLKVILEEKLKESEDEKFFQK